MRSAAGLATAARCCAHVGKPGIDIGRIDILHQGDLAFLLQVALHEPEGRVVPFQRFVALVAAGVIEQVVGDGAFNRRFAAVSRAPFSCFQLQTSGSRLASSAVRRTSAWASSLARWAVARSLHLAAPSGGPPSLVFGRWHFVLFWSSVLASFGASGAPGDKRAAERGRMSRLCEGRMSRAPGQDVTSLRQDVTSAEAGCHPKMRQDVAVHLFTHKKTVSLLSLSPLGCHQSASSACKETVYMLERETGLEPATACLEGRNSTTELLPHELTKNWVIVFFRSGCADLNRGPHGPKPCALPTAPHPANALQF